MDRELLTGKGVTYPRLLEVTLKKAPKARKAAERKDNCRSSRRE
jgi:hypothetical protein